MTRMMTRMMTRKKKNRFWFLNGDLLLKKNEKKINPVDLFFSFHYFIYIFSFFSFRQRPRQEEADVLKVTKENYPLFIILSICLRHPLTLSSEVRKASGVPKHPWRTPELDQVPQKRLRGFEKISEGLETRFGSFERKRSIKSIWEAGRVKSFNSKPSGRLEEWKASKASVRLEESEKL